MSDIDPELLKEAGRASAIQDIASQAKDISDRAKALEATVADSLSKVLRRWRRAFFGILALSIVLLALAVANRRTLIQVQETNEDVDALLEVIGLLVCADPESAVRFEEACARLTLNLGED